MVYCGGVAKMPWGDNTYYCVHTLGDGKNVR